MRLLGSVVLLTGALSVGAYAYLPVISFNHHNLSKLVRIQTPTAAGHAGKAVLESASGERYARSERSFSPSSPEFAEAIDARRERMATEFREGSSSVAWRSVVAAPHGEHAARASASPTDEYVASVELARNLQRELKRVGCYEGDADGDWKAASRRAMGAFLSKVNATLPVDRPDYILLTLLQGHADRACDLTCPTGQGVSSDGRCIPNVVVAQSAAERQTSTAVAAAKSIGDTEPVVAAAPWTARVAPVAAPRIAREKRQVADAVAAAPAPTRPIVVPATDPPRLPTVAVLAPEARVPVPRDVFAPSAEVASIVAREPLPGRMSVGAPVNSGEPSRVLETPASSGRVRPHTKAAHAAFETHEPERAARVARPRAPSVSVRKEPAYGRQPRYVRSYDSAPTIRTTQGKVRRGSPQHNLMLSLGGVF